MMILNKDGKKCIVLNPKKIKFYKTLIDNGKMPRCKYKMKQR